jgi:hypothetical protein
MVIHGFHEGLHWSVVSALVQQHWRIGCSFSSRDRVIDNSNNRNHFGEYAG